MKTKEPTAIFEAGAIRFNVSFDVKMAEIKDWPALRVKQFFDGIAMAKNAAEGTPWSPEPQKATPEEITS